jgi:glycosyltransferase involved in cell wall biosynthesis
MHLGMPVVAACVTEAAEVIPRDAGVVTNDMEALVSGIKRLVADPDEARSRGELARQAALSRFGLKRFLEDWDQLLEQVSAR